MKGFEDFLIEDEVHFFVYLLVVGSDFLMRQRPSRLPHSSPSGLLHIRVRTLDNLDHTTLWAL